MWNELAPAMMVSRATCADTWARAWLERDISCTMYNMCMCVHVNVLHVILLSFLGKTLLAKAVANQTSATFLRVCGSELIQKYLVSLVAGDNSTKLHVYMHVHVHTQHVRCVCTCSSLEITLLWYM